MRVCRHCGTILGDADRYCPYCGTRCDEPVETAVAGRGRWLRSAVAIVVAAAIAVIAYCCYNMLVKADNVVIVETVEPAFGDSIVSGIDSVDTSTL